MIKKIPCNEHCENLALRFYVELIQKNFLIFLTVQCYLWKCPNSIQFCNVDNRYITIKNPIFRTFDTVIQF